MPRGEIHLRFNDRGELGDEAPAPVVLRTYKRALLRKDGNGVVTRVQRRVSTAAEQLAELRRQRPGPVESSRIPAVLANIVKFAGEQWRATVSNRSMVARWKAVRDLLCHLQSKGTCGAGNNSDFRVRADLLDPLLDLRKFCGHILLLLKFHALLDRSLEIRKGGTCHHCRKCCSVGHYLDFDDGLDAADLYCRVAGSIIREQTLDRLQMICQSLDLQLNEIHDECMENVERLIAGAKSALHQALSSVQVAPAQRPNKKRRVGSIFDDDSDSDSDGGGIGISDDLTAEDRRFLIRRRENSHRFEEELQRADQLVAAELRSSSARAPPAAAAKGDDAALTPPAASFPPPPSLAKAVNRMKTSAAVKGVDGTDALMSPTRHPGFAAPHRHFVFPVAPSGFKWMHGEGSRQSSREKSMESAAVTRLSSVCKAFLEWTAESERGGSNSALTGGDGKAKEAELESGDDAEASLSADDDGPRNKLLDFLQSRESAPFNPVSAIEPPPLVPIYTRKGTRA